MVAKVFKSGNSKAIRIPKGLLPDDVEFVEIEVQNGGFLVRPKRFSLDTLYELIEKNRVFTEDFLDDRDQPPAQKRELF